MYGYESTYGTAVSTARVFGRNVKLNISQRNNMERLFSIGARNAQTVAALKYEGNVSVDFIMSNGAFWRGVIGAAPTDAGAGPYTHTYAEPATGTVQSFTIGTGSELGTNDEVSAITGCKVASATMTCAVGEVVRVRLECPFQSISTTTSTYAGQTADSEEPFTFAHGSLQLPSGSTIAYVQNVELTINNDLESVYSIGARTLNELIPKRREYNFRFTAVFSDITTFLTKFLGDVSSPYTPSPQNTPAASATLVLTFTNGLAGTSTRSMVMTFANIYLDEHTLPKDVDEVIKEDIAAYALSLTNIVVTDNTASQSANP
jgi:hypothetical protein